MHNGPRKLYRIRAAGARGGNGRFPSFQKKTLPIRSIESVCSQRLRQFPAVAPALGDAAGSVGMTGATVSSGIMLGTGGCVTTGAAVMVGAALGAFVGVEMFPRAEHVQPTSSSVRTSSGIKKNRFIMRISFRFFSVSMSVFAAVIRLRDVENYAILRV